VKFSTKALALFYLTAFVGLASNTLAYGQGPGLLKGGVMQKDYIKQQAAPSLNRKDIDQMGDPFSSDAPGGPGTFDAPDEAFQQRQPFNLDAQQGQQNMQYQQPIMQQQPAYQAGSQRFPLSAEQEEQHPQMKLAWDQWHKRVAGAIYSRFNGLATTAFKQSQPMACEVAYTVTRDRKIQNIQLIQKSPNIVFNTMVYGVVKSMNGDPMLDFPQGSARQTVDKSGTFLWNYKVQGFKYTINDQETIRQKR